MSSAANISSVNFRPSLSERVSHPRLERLFSVAASFPSHVCAVVHATDPKALQGAIHAAAEGILHPLLIGPEKQIRETAAQNRLDLDGIEIRNTDHARHSIALALELARTGEAQTLMQGAPDNAALLKAILAADSGLHTENRVSHIFVFDVPNYHKPLFVTDAVINADPDLDTKAEIIRNTVDLFRVLKMGVPKIALLAAQTHITRKLPATIDAACLCKQAQRAQIEGAILEGPLTFDIAINAAIARDNGITGPVAGDADVLLAPNLEAGKILEKQLRYFARAEGAGILLGTRIPVILNDRNDSLLVRMMSAALASVVRQAHLDEHDPYAT